MIFSSCRETTRPGDASCERCHAPAGDIAQERDFAAFVRTMPRNAAGNGIDWVAAERRGTIQPVDFLEGISIRRQPLKAQKDFSFDVKAAGVPDVVFSHKKHAVWNGCEVCHPDIFPIKRGVLKYTMRDMEGGKYCGACHDKVAFPLLDCKGCHPGMKK